MPAYDKYVREVIRLIGGTNKIVLNPSNIPKVLDEIILLAHIFLPIINLILNQKRGTWDRCELYTPMKVLDMILFSLGQLLIGSGKQNKTKQSKTKAHP